MIKPGLRSFAAPLVAGVVLVGVMLSTTSDQIGVRFAAVGALAILAFATRALPEIWTEADAFKSGADKMQAAVAKLNAAAKTGNLDAVKTAFGAAGQTCKACHDDYRKD